MNPQNDATHTGDLFTRDMLIQLNTVFDKMERPLLLRLHLDERPVSAELKRYMSELTRLTDKLTMEETTDDSCQDLPCVEVLTADGAKTGLTFHGVPGGHEFTPFILGLYNAAGPGQPIDARDRKDAASIDHDTKIKIMVSLNCTMCPDLVSAAQRIATLNDHVSVDVYDLNHFPDMRDKYNANSVPCYTINDGDPKFGKLSLPALLEIL